MENYDLVINYNNSKDYSLDKIEKMANGKILVIDDYPKFLSLCRLKYNVEFMKEKLTDLYYEDDFEDLANSIETYCNEKDIPLNMCVLTSETSLKMRCSKDFSGNKVIILTKQAKKFEKLAEKIQNKKFFINKNPFTKG